MEGRIPKFQPVLILLPNESTSWAFFSFFAITASGNITANKNIIVFLIFLDWKNIFGIFGWLILNSKSLEACFDKVVCKFICERTLAKEDSIVK